MFSLKRIQSTAEYQLCIDFIQLQCSILFLFFSFVMDRQQNIWSSVAFSLTFSESIWFGVFVFTVFCFIMDRCLGLVAVASVPCCRGDLCSWHFHDSYAWTDGLPEGQRSLYTLPKGVGGEGGGGGCKEEIYIRKDMICSYFIIYCEVKCIYLIVLYTMNLTLFSLKCIEIESTRYTALVINCSRKMGEGELAW